MYHLEEEYSRPVKIKDLENYLKRSKSTISERIKELNKQGLIKQGDNVLLKFTKKGYNIARKLTYKHRIIEVFLYNILKISRNKIHEEANKLEHAFSDDSIKRINKLLNNPKLDPHGQKISV
ncbi:metal-dependent transcriptional regulator [Candidatus Pacearchaeota archaeon]|nr:metal-dependent transcriptional regulator [Candidatus Pacearchaeota archaeon]